MSTELVCPGCRRQLEVISASGRADDLYMCSECYHSWFAFELESRGTSLPDDDGDEDTLR